MGDHVIIEFTDQDWTKPKVIGFYDSPKACPVWVKIKFGAMTVNPAFTALSTRRQGDCTVLATMLGQVRDLNQAMVDMIQDRVGHDYFFYLLPGMQSE